jgi:glycosyltransferase involved in cell wall biosynthesis
MTPLRILQVATSISGGAGIAARRLNEALNMDPDLRSTLLFREGSDGHAQSNEVKIDVKASDRYHSSVRTIFQQKVIQNSSMLVSPIGMDLFPYQNSSYLEAEIVHLHAFYNFMDNHTLERMSNDGKKIFITLHDERFFTGGCHYTAGCLQYQISCQHCPQVRSIFKQFISSNHSRSVAILDGIETIRFISPSQWLADQAKLSTSIGDFPMDVVPNPIPPVFRLTRQSEQKKNLEIDESQITLGFISSDLSNPYKGFEILQQALVNLSSEDKKRFTLILIGGGVILPAIEIPVVRAESRSDQEMAVLLQAIDLLIVPSKQDNLPNVIGEAIASGTAVLGSDSGGVPELLRQSKLPTFESGNWQELSEKISNFDFSYSRESLRDFAANNLSYEKVAQKIKNLYLKA